MKRILLTIVIVTVSNFIYAQSAGKWAINGNAITNGDFIGTTNNEPFILKSNSIVGLKLKTDGSLIIKSLDLGSNNPNGLVITNGQGEISRLNFSGNSNNVLLGDGTWGTLPANANFWQVGNNNKIYYTAGKVGIGTQSPNFDLDVQGNARITNTLIVNGQLIISDKIQTSRQLKSMRVETDSIMMDTTRAIYGKTIVKGDIKAKYNLGVDGNIATNGSILAKQGVMFDGTNGIKFTPANSTMGSIINIGPITPIQPILPPCLAPTQDPWFYFGGRIQLFDVANNVALTMGSDGNTASIDASGNNGLKVNFYCHNDVYLNTAWILQNDAAGNTTATQDGGTTYIGAKADFRKSIKIGYTASGNIDLNTSIEINQNEAMGNGIKLNTFNNALKFITINNSNFTTSPFTVFGDGSINSGSHNINGDVTISSLVGSGSRGVFADANGKLILAPSGATGTSWLLGGNVGNGNSLGTTDNTDLPIITNNTEKMRIDAAGNVLINTASSNNTNYKKTLTVNGDVCFANYDDVNPSNGHANDGFSGFEILGSSKVPTRRGISVDADPDGDINLYINSNQLSSNFKFVNGYNGAVSSTNPFLVKIASDGRTDINAPTKTNKYLVVNDLSNKVSSRPSFIVFGNGRTEIHMDGRESSENALEVHDDINSKINFRVKQNGYVYAREINVMPANINFPDYVFASDYKLMTLNEVENYVNSNKHLPNIPSAKEVEKDGINISEMQVKQMEKIEELFLHLIELKKENDFFKKRIENLENK